ncbi:MAG: type II CAAX endopeptidase family protein [Acidobacteriota bacterium]
MIPSRPDPSAGAPPPADPSAPEPLEPRRRVVGLRVAVYVFAVMMSLSVGMTTLLLVLRGPEALEQLAEASDPISAGFDGVLLFWLQAASVPLALLVTLGFLRLDRRRFADLGVTLSVPWPSTLAAVGVGAGLVGLWRLVVEPFSTWRAVAPTADQLERFAAYLPFGVDDWLLFAAGFLIMSFFEEMVFRGYVFTTLRDRFTWVHAAGFSSLLALAFTAGAPEADALALGNTFLFGLLLAALREKTGSIWPGTLLHALWNVLVAHWLSVPVSGILYPSPRTIEVEGAASVTGGAYGPEASAVLLPMLLALIAAAAWWIENDRPPEADADLEPTSADRSPPLGRR